MANITTQLPWRGRVGGALSGCGADSGCRLIRAAVTPRNILACPQLRWLLHFFTLATYPSNSVLLVWGNGRMLRRLMRNLLENAQRYAAGSPVETGQPADS
jgi:signal transduction histidine kinase